MWAISWVDSCSCQGLQWTQSGVVLHPHDPWPRWNSFETSCSFDSSDFLLVHPPSDHCPCCIFGSSSKSISYIKLSTITCWRPRNLPFYFSLLSRREPWLEVIFVDNLTCSWIQCGWIGQLGLKGTSGHNLGDQPWPNWKPCLGSSCSGYLERFVVTFFLSCLSFGRVSLCFSLIPLQ